MRNSHALGHTFGFFSFVLALLETADSTQWFAVQTRIVAMKTFVWQLLLDMTLKPTVAKHHSQAPVLSCKFLCVCLYVCMFYLTYRVVSTSFCFRQKRYDPQICGSKDCPYDNLCVAQLAGYDANQCMTAPEPCPTGNESQCSGEPSNPLKCGSGKQCPYESICLAQTAGFDITTDCCQDTRAGTACASIFAPVSCGPPAGKQCPYDNQCLAGTYCCCSATKSLYCSLVFRKSYSQ